jgi:beta-N-acetylhexosaminidase
MKHAYRFLSYLILLSLVWGLSGCGLGVSPSPIQLAPTLSRLDPLPPIPTRQVYDFNAVQPWVETTLGSMSPAEKIGQLLLVGIEGDKVTPENCAYIQQLKPAGITLSGENLPDPDTLRAFTTGLQECAQAAGMPPLLMTLAHEGEYVDRFRGGTTLFPAALAQGATGDPQSAYQASLASGQELAYSGVNLILGPVADVLTDYDNEVISQRTYGGDTSQVSQFVSNAVLGYRAAGLLPVLKHFPGHGGVSGDSHRVMPIDRADLETIKNIYLPPFQAGIEAGAPMVMISHVSYPAIDEGREIPATVSKDVVNLLREEMGFTGVILSDAMRMRAVTRVMTSPEASLQALQAGFDLLLTTIPADAQETQAYLLDGMTRGRLTSPHIDEAVRRVLTLKAMYGLSSYPVALPDAPDWQLNTQLADRIGERAVTLLKNEAGLVPLPQKKRNILVMGPSQDWELYPMLRDALMESGFNADFAPFPPPWDGKIKDRGLRESLVAQAGMYDLVLLFTWQAHLNRLTFEDTWQADLVNQLRESGKPLVVVAIKSPTDILEFPDVSTYIAMFGTTPGQEQALIDALVGRAILQGVNPLPGLLP